MADKTGLFKKIQPSYRYNYHPHAKGKHYLSFQEHLPSPETVSFELARETAQRTQDLLEAHGWCFWKCRNLGDDTIIITRSAAINGIPKGYTWYTLEEIDKLGKEDINESALRLIHGIKKQGAIITSSEDGAQDRL